MNMKWKVNRATGIDIESSHEQMYQQKQLHPFTLSKLDFDFVVFLFIVMDSESDKSDSLSNWMQDEIASWLCPYLHTEIEWL